MKALVTGGTGFIGSHLVEALIKRGFEVHCLVRDPARPGWLKGLDVELIRGDCCRPETLSGVAHGMDYVFHAAGITKTRDAREYYLVNGEGTRNIAEAAASEAGGLRKFIYISSQAAAGPSREGVPRKEDDPPEPVTDYGKSKLLGEKYALALRERFNLAIIRPTAVYGPRDRDIYEFFRIISRGFRTSFKDERLLSICYVEDLAEGIILSALGDTTSGETFFIAEKSNYSWDYLGAAIAEALGVKARKLVVPLPVLDVVAVLAEAVSALNGKPALLNRQKVAEIKQRYWVVDTARARERLNFSARFDFKTGSKLTAEWYRHHGWI
ncbi:MAG: NAD-dependent epimerase/dehydratase family protein [Nitrospirota bacterium]